VRASLRFTSLYISMQNIETKFSLLQDELAKMQKSEKFRADRQLALRSSDKEP
jgi:hypothetical protein